MNSSYEIAMRLNADKARSNQPDLLGDVVIDGDPFRVALWEQITQTGGRHYYSGTVSRDGDKDAPKHKLKLYEFRKNSSVDPDFGSPSPCELPGDRRLFAYLTISITPEGEDISLVLVPERIHQRPTELTSSYRETLLERFGKSAKGMSLEDLRKDLDDNLNMGPVPKGS